MDPLARQLVTKQAQEGLDDAQFARTLGIARGTWNGIKNGKAPVGPKVYGAVLLRYPSLADDVLVSLKRQAAADLQEVA